MKFVGYAAKACKMGMILTVLLLAGLAWMIQSARRGNSNNYIVPADLAAILAGHVDFYNELDDTAKASFEERIKAFLGKVAVRGVNVRINDTDRALVAAGAIIPIFAFPDWEYKNIHEVLIYPTAFTKKFSIKGAARNVLGMVGDGVMNKAMILAKPSLHASFHNGKDGQNTVIHEFVHLIDKADGVVDGIPEYLLARPYMQPWVSRMHETIKEMRNSAKSDIDMYGASSDAEFFAVVSEYFFEQPDKLKEHHPQLYGMLVDMFQTQK